MFVIQYLNNIPPFYTSKIDIYITQDGGSFCLYGIVQSPAARLNKCNANGPFNHSSTPSSHNHGNVDRTHSQAFHSITADHLT